MADESDKYYNIHINTDANLVGVDALVAKFREVAQARKIVADEMKAAAANDKAQQAAVADAVKAAADKEREAMEQVKEREREVSEAAQEVGNAIRLGFSVDLVHRFVEALAEGPRKLEEMIHEGIEFNAQMERIEQSITTSFQAFENGSGGLAESGEKAHAVMDSLFEDAQRAGQPYKELLTLFTSTGNVAAQQGVQLDKWKGFLGEAALAATNMNVQLSELDMGLRMLLEGHIYNRNPFIAKLGIDADALEKAKAAGNLVDYLTERVQIFARETDKEPAVLNRLENQLQRTLGEVTKPLFDQIVDSAKELTEDIEQIDPTAIKDLARELALLLEVGTKATEWAMKHSEAILLIAKAATIYGSALTALKLVEFVANLALSASGLGAETAALTANTAAQAANAAARVTNAGAAATEAGAVGTEGAAQGASAAGAGAGILGRSITMAGGIAIIATAGVLALDQWLKVAAAQQQALEIEDEIQKTYSNENRELQKRLFSMETAEDKERMRKELIIDIHQYQSALSAAQERGDAIEIQAIQNQIALREHDLGMLDDIFEKSKQVVAQQREQNAELDRETQYREHLKDLEKKAPKVKEELDKIAYENMSPEEKLAAAQKKMDEATNGQGYDAYKGLLTGIRPSDKSTFGPDVIQREEIDAKLLQIEQAKKELQEAQNAVDEDNKRKATDAKHTSDEQQHAAEQAQREADRQEAQRKARQMALVDLQLSEAKARGDEQAVKLLEHRLAVMKEILRIMEETGASEEQAWKFAEAKVTAEEKAKEREAAAKKDQEQQALINREVGQGNHLGQARHYGNAAHNLGDPYAPHNAGMPRVAPPAATPVLPPPPLSPTATTGTALPATTLRPAATPAAGADGAAPAPTTESAGVRQAAAGAVAEINKAAAAAVAAVKAMGQETVDGFRELKREADDMKGQIKEARR